MWTGDSTTIAAPIAVRGYARPVKERSGKRPQPDHDPGAFVVVFDTETRTDFTQRLLFASYRVYDGGELTQEGLVAADDLRPPERAILERYVTRHRADNGRRIRLRTRASFLEDILFKSVYKGRRATLVGFNLPFDLSRIAFDWRPSKGSLAGGFTFAMFEWVRPDGRRAAHQYRPSLAIRALDAKRELTQFLSPLREKTAEMNADGWRFGGRFLDLHTLAYALTDRSYSLAGACDAFETAERKWDEQEQAAKFHHGVLSETLVEYNRQDVLASWSLYGALMAEYARHPIDLAAPSALSPAAIGKAYLRAMGIAPPAIAAQDFPLDRLGHAMSAYYGGRAECRVRRTEVPVTYLDVASMYPSVFALGGLWPWVIAERLTAEDATADANAILAATAHDALLDPALWRQLAGVFCRIAPAGELVPVRAPYRLLRDTKEADAPPGHEWQIGLNYLERSPRELWFTLADLIAGAVLGGPRPVVLEAFRVVPSGVQAALQPTKLHGSVEVDPRDLDPGFFVRVIEERQRAKRDETISEAERERLDLFLKTIANAAAYGIAAEMRAEAPVGGEGAEVQVAGLSEFRCRVHRPERPGEFCFPPLAATVTGLGRLLLALLEGEIEARGGTYLACDTDGMAVVASRTGGSVALPGGDEVRALSWAEVDEIRARLNRLNPYDRTRVADLIKLEDENFRQIGSDKRGRPVVDKADRVDLLGAAISAKRFALYEHGPGGETRLRKRSEHGLGALLSPTEPPPAQPREISSEGAPAARAWIDETWLRLIDSIRGREVAQEPTWYGRPALSQIGTTSPALLAPFASFNAGRPYEMQIKPFNFLLLAHDDPLAALPDGLDRNRLTPVAPYERTAAKWLGLDWRNRFDGQSVAVTTRPGGSPDAVSIRTYGDVIGAYATHPEAKSAGPDGRRCSVQTVGRLGRLHVIATAVEHIGKESNALEEVEAGVVRTVEDPTLRYEDQEGEWRAALPALRALRDARGWRYLAEASGLSERAVRYALNGGMVPREVARTQLMRLVGAESLRSSPLQTPFGSA